MFSRTNRGGNSNESQTPRRFSHGVSTSSKSISKTPAQDRLQRIRKTLSDNLTTQQIKSQELIQSLQASGIVNTGTSLFSTTDRQAKPAIKLPESINRLASTSSSNEKETTSPTFDRYSIRKSLGLSKNNARPDYLKSTTTPSIGKCLVPPDELCALLKARSDRTQSNTTTAQIPPTEKAAPAALNSKSRKRKSDGISSEIDEKVMRKSTETSNQSTENEKIKISKLMRRAKKTLRISTETKQPVQQMELDDDEQFRIPTQSSEKNNPRSRQEDNREKENQLQSRDEQSAQQQPLTNYRNESAPENSREKDKPKNDDVITSPPTTFNTGSLFQNIREGIKSAFESYVNKNNIKTLFHNMTKTTQCETSRLKNQCIYVVPDTNIFLQHLTFIKGLVEEPIQKTVKVVIYVPYVVIEELDKLKEQNNRSVSTLAQRAIKYLNEKLQERDESIRGQTVVESIREIIPIKKPDDSILNCCLQLKERDLKFIILSNDINLRNKALVNNIRAYNSLDVESGNLSKFL